jgi:Protein of unknown function (DUF1488)
MFFTFPENAHWDVERQAVEFGVELGEYRGVVRVPRQVFQRLLPERPTPERCVEAYYLARTRFESIAERKLRRRQLTEDGNVEITGRDLRERAARCPEERERGDDCLLVQARPTRWRRRGQSAIQWLSSAPTQR